MWISAWKNMDTRYSAAQFSCHFLGSHWNLFEFLEIYLSANDIADLVFTCLVEDQVLVLVQVLVHNLWQRGLHNNATPDTMAKMSMDIIWSVGVSPGLHAVSIPVCTLSKRKKKHIKHNHSQPDTCSHKRIRSDAKMISTTCKPSCRLSHSYLNWLDVHHNVVLSCHLFYYWILSKILGSSAPKSQGSKK